jgi:hypothetical protein
MARTLLVLGCIIAMNCKYESANDLVYMQGILQVNAWRVRSRSSLQPMQVYGSILCSFIFVIAHACSLSKRYVIETHIRTFKI